jgi:predicted nucleotidyltransferase
MAYSTINPEILSSVSKYRRVVESAGIPVRAMILFGSYAKGTQRVGSDIDLAVVSPMFGDDTIGDMQTLWKKTRLADVRIEPYPLSVEEYEHGYGPMVHEIRKFGIAV